MIDTARERGIHDYPRFSLRCSKFVGRSVSFPPTRRMEITLANREMRGKEQCSFFGVLILGKLYAIGTLIGSVGAPLLFGFLIATGSRVKVVRGDGSGAALMMSGAVCENLIGWKQREKAWSNFAAAAEQSLVGGQRSQKRILSEVFNGARRGT